MIDMSLTLPPHTLKHQRSTISESASTRSLTRCSIITVCDTTEDLSLHQRLNRKQTAFSTETCSTAAASPSCTVADCSIPSDQADGDEGGISKQQAVLVRKSATSTPPLLAQDDLRAYAYEGDGSPSGSLSSTVLGMNF